MKQIFSSLLALFLVFILLGLVTTPRSAYAAVCTQTSFGWKPINDLGSGFYTDMKGVQLQGGFYGSGINTMPSLHRQAGATIVGALQPLNGGGVIDTVNGKIVMISKVSISFIKQ